MSAAHVTAQQMLDIRYALLIQNLLAIATIYPMSDLYSFCQVALSAISTITGFLICKADGWTQDAIGIPVTIVFSAFSALRAYALSNRNMWLTAIIILLALPPTAMFIARTVNDEFHNLPSPFNCTGSSSLSPAFSIIYTSVTRGSQFAAELLVVGITWWYTCQSYRIRKGIKLGKTISSLLVYNGLHLFPVRLMPHDAMISGGHSKLHRFLATWYIFDIVLSTASISPEVLHADSFVQQFYDPITSILTCRFMLSLRQFDSSSTAFPTLSVPGSQVREHTASADVLQFAAQPSDTLPSFIASFAHPVHVDSALSETDPAEIFDDGSEWGEIDVVAPTLEAPSSQRRTSDQPSNLEHSV
ncbi:hypothetical protein LXA43DRAFT_1067939 [Ganoderma leucocontextum]|nr:hypothetical protein LXA43DRAFT_1067939 [Ganoderma leucocontextum]